MSIWVFILARWWHLYFLLTVDLLGIYKIFIHSDYDSDIWLLTKFQKQPEVLLRKRVLKLCSKFTGEHPCRSPSSIKLLCMAWLFSCKFAAYFQNTFSLEHLWAAASEIWIRLQVVLEVELLFSLYCRNFENIWNLTYWWLFCTTWLLYKSC